MATCGSNAANEMIEGGLLTVEEAAAFSRLSRSELFLKMGDGSLVTVKHGRRRLIPKRALVEMLGRGLTKAN